jgi:hypothetical protein
LLLFAAQFHSLNHNIIYNINCSDLSVKLQVTCIVDKVVLRLRSNLNFIFILKCSEFYILYYFVEVYISSGNLFKMCNFYFRVSAALNVWC